MTEEEKPKRGRPRKAEGDTLSERTGGFYLSKLEREGLDWMISQDDAQARRFNGRATESSLLRGLVQAELIRRRWDRAHLLPQAAVAPELPAAAAPTALEAPPAPPAAPELPAAPPPPVAAPPPAAVEAPLAAPVRGQDDRAPAQETPAKPRKVTPASVRKLMEEAYAAKLSRGELSERSGVRVDLLSRFRSNANPERAELKPEQLAALDGALRRWLEEQGGAR